MKSLLKNRIEHSDSLIKAKNYYIFGRFDKAITIFGVVLCSLIVFVFRTSERLFNPQLVAEDGVFFQNTYNLSFLDTIFLPYRGGFYVFSRILYEVALVFRLDLVPLVFVVLALVVQIFCCTIFLSERFSWIVPNVWYRAFFCILLATIPASSEIHLRLYNVHWYLGILAFLLVIMEAPYSWRGKFLYMVSWVLIGFSAPQTIVFLPCLAVRALVDRRLRWFSFIAVVGLGIVVFLTVQANTERVRGTGGLQLVALGVALFNALAFRVLTVGTVGLSRLFDTFYQYDDLRWMYVLLLPYLALIISGAYFFWQQQRRDYLLVWVALIYCTIAPIALLFLGRADFLQARQHLSGLWGDDRYYVLPICTFYFTLLFWWLSLSPYKNRYLRSARWLLVLPILFAVTSDFFVHNVFISDFQWKSQVRRIKQAEALAPGSILDVPINPTNEWTMRLHVPPSDLPAYINLRVASQEVQGYFDFAARNTTPAGLDPQPSQKISTEEGVRAAGWVLADGTPNHPNEVLVISIMEQKVIARTSVLLERPDLASMDPRLLISGWQVVFPADQLSAGVHVLRAYAFDAKTQTAYPIPGEIRITIIGT